MAFDKNYFESHVGWHHNIENSVSLADIYSNYYKNWFFLSSVLLCCENIAFVPESPRMRFSFHFFLFSNIQFLQYKSI